MATPRGQFYSKSLALLIWLQNFEKCISSKYNIDLAEMDFLASRLTPQECYDFYTQLSHRKAIRGGISIYALKEKAHQLPCISLLATWLTDPEESAFRSHENIELKLRNIGRKDLARWIVERIESSLQRKRRLDDEESNRRIEESQQNEAIVVDRIGERIMPSVSLDNHQPVIDSKNIDDKDNSCIFWKIFFSVLVVFLLILLFACFYRFLYTKLRCICRRFDDSEDRKCCLPSETYGAASASDLSPKEARKKCNFIHCSANSNGQLNEARNFVESSDFESSAIESNEEFFNSTIEVKRALLLNSGEKSDSKVTKKINCCEFVDERSKNNYRTENQILINKKFGDSRSEFFFTWDRNGRKKFNKIDSENELVRSFSDAHLNFAKLASSRISCTKKCAENKTEDRKNNFCRNYEDQSPKWTFCSCNLISESQKMSSKKQEKCDKKVEICRDNYFNYSGDEKCSEKIAIFQDSYFNNSLKASPTSSEISSTEKPKNLELQKGKCSELKNEKCDERIENCHHNYFNSSKNFSSSSEISSTGKPKNSELKKEKCSELKNHKCVEKIENCHRNNLNSSKVSSPSSEISSTGNSNNSELQKGKCSELKNQKCVEKIEKGHRNYLKNSSKMSSTSSEISLTEKPKNSELPMKKSSELKNQKCVANAKNQKIENGHQNYIKNAELLEEKCWKILEIHKNNCFDYSHGDAESELSETYNELGMLFSEEMKRQWRPCRRRHCPLSRKLRTCGKSLEHDEKKCRTRLRANFGYRVVRIDERPACSSAEICRDTYDEFELMRATRTQLEGVARAIVERRKRFLDQPCLSPIPKKNVGVF